MSITATPLSEQIILVTGGARGLGKAVTEAFLREGARVVVNYFSSDQEAQAIVDKHPGQAVAIQADVRDRAQIDALFARAREEFGAQVTTVVSNALIDFSFDGDARPKAEDIAYERFESQFAGAVQGTLNVTQAALPGFDEFGSGRIITIGTNLFQYPVVPYHDYTAAKAALLSLTRTLASDLGPRGVTVNMLSGGLLRTTDASSATPDEVFDLIASGTPFGLGSLAALAGITLVAGAALSESGRIQGDPFVASSILFVSAFVLLFIIYPLFMVLRSAVFAGGSLDLSVFAATLKHPLFFVLDNKATPANELLLTLRWAAGGALLLGGFAALRRRGVLSVLGQVVLGGVLGFLVGVMNHGNGALPTSLAVVLIVAPTSARGEDLFAQDVGMPAVLGQLAHPFG